MNKRMVTKKINVSLAFAMMLIITIETVIAIPNGVLVTPGESQTAPINGSASVGALAGNITELNIDGQTTSQAWQGYYGNISGGFILSDYNNNMIYNWSSVTANGEVYASINASIIWNNVLCFNFTSTGDFQDDSLNKGNTSLFGMNSSQLESLYNIGIDDVDGLDETFNQNTHEMFFTNNLQFDTGECQNIKLLNSSGTGVFDEVLLYSPDNQNIIFTSLLKESQKGFDNNYHDFQMLVLDDGHGADIQTTDYYFYMELG